MPCGIVINHVLSTDKAFITLFREIPNEEKLYAMFHPPFDVIKKYRLEPPNIRLFSGAWFDSGDVKLLPDLYRSPVIYVFPVISW